ESRSSLAQPDDDIAALEREARARREAELLTAQEEEENDSVQPTVNRLKKRRRGRATAFLALAAVALIALTWAGNWVYRNFLWQPGEEKRQDAAPQPNRSDYRQRTDLGT
ncbi:type VI secretion protein, partial [Klebsiella variicola subsp. variicola]|nr:type VI secretion protein [Klebsiella variicola subsp. variicola]